MTDEDAVPDELALALKAAEDLAPHVRNFANSIGLRDPAREIVGGWNDRLQIRREVRRLEALVRAADRIRELGVPTRAVRDRLLVEILEGAADEDDPELSEVWSNLLANAATGMPVAPAFPSVLRQLEPIEARLLDAGLRRQRELPPGANVDVEDLPGFDELEWRHLDNLERLALIAFRTGLPVNVELPKQPTDVYFMVNPFGEAFVETCSAPPAPQTAAEA